MGRTIILPVSNTELRKQYESGMNTYQLAEKYGCSDVTIGKRLKSVGCKMVNRGMKGKKHSDETRRKMSAKRKGRTFSDETRKKLSDSQKGERGYWYGKQFSAEHKKKIGAAGKRENLSDETLRKMRERTGAKNPFYGKTFSDEARKKLSEAHKGAICSDETRKKMRAAHKGAICSDEARKKRSASLQGIPLSEWNGFVEKNPYCEKFNNSCRERNREKYDRECFICGKPESKNLTKTGKARKLSVHHVDRNKNQGCDGTDWALVPICSEHHQISHSKLWQSRIAYLLSKEKKR